MLDDAGSEAHSPACRTVATSSNVQNKGSQSEYVTNIETRPSSLLNAAMLAESEATLQGWQSFEVRDLLMMHQFYVQDLHSTGYLMQERIIVRNVRLLDDLTTDTMIDQLRRCQRCRSTAVTPRCFRQETQDYISSCLKTSEAALYAADSSRSYMKTLAQIIKHRHTSNTFDAALPANQP